MRYLLISLLSVISFCAVAQVGKINPALQKPYLPKEVKGLYIGMPKQDAMKLHKAMRVQRNPGLEYPVENFKTGDVKKITCQVTNEDNTVYQFIVEYRSTAKAIAIAKKLFGEVNDASGKFPLGWEIKLDDGLVLKCWIFENKICIADSRQF